MSAATTNAQHLGIDPAVLRDGVAAATPRQVSDSVPPTLKPIELQHQVAHDPIIDTIPHPRLRFNILRAIATRQIEASQISACIRGSGTLKQSSDSWQRGGLVVWSSPERLSSWEVSEPFVRHWTFLLQGCEDLTAATNAWRSRRGEKLFPSSVA